jgi:hypothetical protein
MLAPSLNDWMWGLIKFRQRFRPELQYKVSRWLAKLSTGEKRRFSCIDIKVRQGAEADSTMSMAGMAKWRGISMPMQKVMVRADSFATYLYLHDGRRGCFQPLRPEKVLGTFLFEE